MLVLVLVPPVGTSPSTGASTSAFTALPLLHKRSEFEQVFASLGPNSSPDVFEEEEEEYLEEGNEDEEKEKSIKDILNTKYNVQTFKETDEEEPSKEEIVIGKDLPADKIKNKLSDLKEKAVKKAMEDMNLTKKSKIVITEEE